MNNFFKRLLSGILFIVIIIGSILIHYYAFAVVFSLIASGAVFEFHRATNRQESVELNPVVGILGTIILFASSFLVVANIFSLFVFFIYALYVIAVLVIELFRKKKNPIHNWAYFLLGQILIALPFSLLNFIYQFGSLDGFYLIVMFAIIWANDTGAYLAGVSFGKHKMFVRVSPKKSWEGLIGGLVLALFAGYVFSLFRVELSLLNWILISLITVLFGTFGDLLESLMKRTLEVKDSGIIMPGHGGLLDRFDSMLLVAPAYFIFLSFLFK